MKPEESHRVAADFFEQKETKKTKSRFRIGILRCLGLLLLKFFPEGGADGEF
jgi:hypothetical protein